MIKRTKSQGFCSFYAVSFCCYLLVVILKLQIDSEQEQMIRKLDELNRLISIDTELIKSELIKINRLRKDLLGQTIDEVKIAEIYQQVNNLLNDLKDIEKSVIG